MKKRITTKRNLGIHEQMNVAGNILLDVKVERLGRGGVVVCSGGLSGKWRSVWLYHMEWRDGRRKGKVAWQSLL